MSFDTYYNKKEYTKVGGYRKKAILDFIKKKDALVLDIGCSDGEMGEIIKKEKGSKVFGIDISKVSVDKAKQKLDNAFVVDLETEIDSWPEELKKKQFDYIIISEVLEHIMEPEKILEKIKKLLHKDTEIIITVPNILFWKNRLKIFLGSFEYSDKGLMDRGHVHFFSWKSFKKMIWKSGFELIKINNHIPTRGTRKLGKIFPGLFSFQFVVGIKKKRKVVYTAIFGGKDNLIDPRFINKEFDYICFTDSNLSSDIWTVKKVDCDLNDPVRCARKYKILAHKYLSDYDCSVWVDGNMLIISDLNKFCKEYLQDDNIAMYNHSKLMNGPRNCIYKEADELIEMAKNSKYKDDPVLIKRQIDYYRHDEYPEDNGLVSSMVVLRSHNEADVVKTMESWWQEIVNFSRRDQLSFNYVAWKNKLKFKYINKDSMNNKYFKRAPHKINRYER